MFFTELKNCSKVPRELYKRNFCIKTLLSRKFKNCISKFFFGVSHVWVIVSLEIKMKENGHKNMFHFVHEQNCGCFKEKKPTKNIYGKKRSLLISQVNLFHFLKYTFSIAILNSL